MVNITVVVSLESTVVMWSDNWSFWSIYKKTPTESPKVTLWFSLYPN